MAKLPQADITSRDGIKEVGTTTVVEDESERAEVEVVAVEQPYKCSCRKEKISNQLMALRGMDREKKTVIEDMLRSPSFEVRVLPSPAAVADIQNDPFQIKSSTFLSDFDVMATTGEVEDPYPSLQLRRRPCDICAHKTPTKSFEHTTDTERVPVMIFDTNNDSFDGIAVETQHSPTSQFEFDILATRVDGIDSEMDHSHDAYEIKRKTQAMKDLDVLLVDDESDSSTFSMDEEDEKSIPEENESNPGNGWLFSVTMDDIDEVVEELISPLDSITSFISWERDDSIIIDKIESVCADDSILIDKIDGACAGEDIILEYHIEDEECAD